MSFDRTALLSNAQTNRRKSIVFFCWKLLCPCSLDLKQDRFPRHLQQQQSKIIFILDVHWMEDGVLGNHCWCSRRMCIVRCSTVILPSFQGRHRETKKKTHHHACSVCHQATLSTVSLSLSRRFNSTVIEMFSYLIEMMMSCSSRCRSRREIGARRVICRWLSINRKRKREREKTGFVCYSRNGWCSFFILGRWTMKINKEHRSTKTMMTRW